jgi:O-antigen/teichoic acid export membrane protein
MLIQHLFRGFSLYLSSLFLVYYLGYEKFGEISIGLSIIAVLMPISKLGFDNVLIKEYSKTKKIPLIISTSFFFCLFFNIGLSIVLAIWLIIFDVKEIYNYLILISILNFNCIQSIDSLHQSKRNYFNLSIIKSGGYIFSLLLKILTAKYFPNFIYIAITLDYLLIFILLFVYDPKIRNLIKIKFFNTKYLKKLLLISYPLIISGSLGYLSIKMNIFIINYYSNLKSIGIYNFCSMLFEGWSSIFYILSIATMPTLINIKEENKFIIIEKYLKYSNIFLITLFVILMICYCAISTYKIEFLILSIFALSSIFLNFGYMSAKIFILNNKTHITLMRNFLLALFTFIISIILTDILGIIGSAISLLLSLILTNFIFDYFLPNEFKYLFKLKIKSLRLLK